MKKIFADHFREREDGSTIPLIALTCFVMFGAIAFIADVGLWDSQKFDLQVGTDLAALSAGHSIIRDEDRPDNLGIHRRRRTQVRHTGEQYEELH